MSDNSSIRFESGVAADNNQLATPGDGLSPDPAMTQAIADTQGQLATMMVKARRSIKLRASAIHPDLHPMGFKVLMQLARSGPTPQSLLARKLEMDKALLSRIVKQLEATDLIVRSVDPHDGRALLVDMTDHAHERYTSSLLASRQELVDKLSQWDVTEVRRLSDLLARLNETAY